ncbi:hypothetical protein [Mycobacterium sp.]|uniref:hypothetical protein n=1 Tax=Mycobacterium sp. TaxID=1785 RepID=UPI003F98876D
MAKRLEGKQRCICVILGASAHHPYDRKILRCIRRPPFHAAAVGGLVLGDEHHAIDKPPITNKTARHTCSIAITSDWLYGVSLTAY